MFIAFKDWMEKREFRIDEKDQTVNYLKGSVEAIVKMVGDKTIVILGRDAWPLVPMLRRRSVKTQYFLYSRLQIGDKETQERWFREVPHGSYVIDTGYAGSILDDIRRFDPSIKGVLMSSTGTYPELDVPNFSKPDRSDAVDDIEAMPKIIPRSQTFQGERAVLTKRKSDYDVDSSTKKFSASAVANQNKDDLLKLGVPEQDAEKYKKFSGIPLSQRIGNSNLFKHYFDVSNSRRQEWDKKIREKDRKKEADPPTLEEHIEDELMAIATNSRSVRFDPAKWVKYNNNKHLSYYEISRFETVVKRHLRHAKALIYETGEELKKIPHWDEDALHDTAEQHKKALQALLNLSKYAKQMTQYYGSPMTI